MAGFWAKIKAWFTVEEVVVVNDVKAAVAALEARVAALEAKGSAEARVK